jgi:hypothetical protein
MGRKNKSVRRLAFVLPSLQRLGAGGAGMLLKAIADVLVELELSLNGRRPPRQAGLVNGQCLRQRLALRIFEQIAQGLV